MKKIMLLSVFSFAFILFASTSSNAQGVIGRAVEFYFKSTTELNKGERDYEKQPRTKQEKEQIQKEQKELKEQREQREQQERQPRDRPSDRDCTRGGRRDN